GNPSISLQNSRGTIAAPLAVNSGDSLGSINFFGATDNAWGVQRGATIWATSAENFSAGANGTHIGFSTASIGTNVPTIKMILTANANVGIGTSSRQRPLHIASSTASIILEVPGAAFDLKKRYIANMGSGAQGFGKFSDDMSTSTEHLRIDTHGN